MLRLLVICLRLVALPSTLYQLPLKKLHISGCKKLPLDTVERICEHFMKLEELGLAGLEITGSCYNNPSNVAPVLRLLK